MEIIKTADAFEITNGKPKFSYVKYFLRQDGVVYYGEWHNNRSETPDHLGELRKLQQIQTEGRGPKIRPTWLGVYVKTPSLLAYINGFVDIETQIRREVDTCEILREKQPRPNIATYYGCQVTRGQVSGICFKQYTSTLLEKVNPRCLNKDAFRLSGRELVDETIRASLGGIWEGIKHLHSLGIIHNDINPANIMFDEHDTPVLIDFDSCRRVGESLRDTHTKRTHQWHDPDVKTASEKNDVHAFQELRTWLIGPADEKYLF
jgi:serine/threonine protein kinase